MWRRQILLLNLVSRAARCRARKAVVKTQMYGEGDGQCKRRMAQWQITEGVH